MDDAPTGDRRLDRDTLKDELWGQGVPDDLAEALIARWEASDASRAVQGDDRYWDRALEWIDRERGAS
jgi:hypothetical protein